LAPLDPTSNLQKDLFVDAARAQALGAEDQPLGSAIGDTQVAGVTSPPNVYDRSRAVTYARRYWNAVCSDGYVAVGATPWYRAVSALTKFKPLLDEEGQKIVGDELPGFATKEELDDCTHFISCCIGREANELGGGVSVPRDFPNGPYGVLSVARMVTFLRDAKAANGGHLVEIRRTVDEADVAWIRAGDLIAYLDNLGKYRHLAMYLGESNIACHTYMRSDEPDCTWDHKWNLAFKRGSWMLIRFQNPKT
jgi:hypothetical protein